MKNIVYVSFLTLTLSASGSIAKTFEVPNLQTPKINISKTHKCSISEKIKEYNSKFSKKQNETYFLDFVIFAGNSNPCCGGSCPESCKSCC